VNTSSEVGDASLALAARRPDAICQIPGNLTATAFPTILHAADAARIPIFAFQGTQGRAGAIVTFSRDFHEAGMMSGQLAAKVVRGTKPGDLPYQPVTRNHIIVNLTAARRLGIEVPADVVASAAEVIGR
jgi:putative tryptophan/tyrosine transport system substrate-binding protein